MKLPFLKVPYLDRRVSDTLANLGIMPSIRASGLGWYQLALVAIRPPTPGRRDDAIASMGVLRVNFALQRRVFHGYLQYDHDPLWEIQC